MSNDKVETQIKRGSLIGQVITRKPGQYLVQVFTGTKKIKEAGPFFDQDEAEVELGTIIDNLWRESSGKKNGLVRRL